MTTIGAAVATADNRWNTAGFVAQYKPELADVMPSHVKPEAWVRQVAGALRKGDWNKQSRMFELEIAAQNNPAAFMQALRQAASLGLTPGTDEYYLTPRKVGGRTEILGIVGYQGYVELMYRAGAVSSVVAEIVHSKDKFTYVIGRDERPIHEVDWLAADRGPAVLVYSYAVMKDGATSKVVILSQHDIDRIKKSAKGADSQYSPWTTNPDAMWLKSAVRQLRKWTPTSSEFITTQIRAAREGEKDAPGIGLHIPDTSQDETPDEVIEAEFVDDEA